MHRFCHYAVLLLLLWFCITSFSGCPQQHNLRDGRNVWIVNNSEQPITGLFICGDPRQEEWGNNLLTKKLRPGGIELLSTGVPKDEVRWLWPHLEGEGLIAVGVLPGSCDIYVAVNTNDDGDYRVRILGAAQSPFSVRYLLVP